MLPEHLHSFILQLASPAEMDAEKAKVTAERRRRLRSRLTDLVLSTGIFLKYLGPNLGILGPKLQCNFYPHGHETSDQIEAENLLEKGLSHVGSHGTAVAGKAMGGQAISPAFQLIYNLVQVQGLGMRSGG